MRQSKMMGPLGADHVPNGTRDAGQETYVTLQQDQVERRLGGEDNVDVGGSDTGAGAGPSLALELDVELDAALVQDGYGKVDERAPVRGRCRCSGDVEQGQVNHLEHDRVLSVGLLLALGPD